MSKLYFSLLSPILPECAQAQPEQARRGGGTVRLKWPICAREKGRRSTELRTRDEYRTFSCRSSSDVKPGAHLGKTSLLRPPDAISVSGGPSSTSSTNSKAR